MIFKATVKVTGIIEDLEAPNKKKAEEMIRESARINLGDDVIINSIKIEEVEK